MRRRTTYCYGGSVPSPPGSRFRPRIAAETSPPRLTAGRRACSRSPLLELAGPSSSAFTQVTKGDGQRALRLAPVRRRSDLGVPENQERSSFPPVCSPGGPGGALATLSTLGTRPGKRVPRVYAHAVDRSGDSGTVVLGMTGATTDDQENWVRPSRCPIPCRPGDAEPPVEGSRTWIMFEERDFLLGAVFPSAGHSRAGGAAGARW
jgi:hypothetical protein